MVDASKILASVRDAIERDVMSRLPRLNKKRFHHSFSVSADGDRVVVRITNWEGKPCGWIGYVKPQIAESDVLL